MLSGLHEIHGSQDMLFMKFLERCDISPSVVSSYTVRLNEEWEPDFTGFTLVQTKKGMAGTKFGLDTAEHYYYLFEDQQGNFGYMDWSPVFDGSNGYLNVLIAGDSDIITIEQDILGLIEGSAKIEKPNSEEISMHFFRWDAADGSIRDRIRTHTAQKWEEVEKNYSATVRKAMGDLMAMGPGDITGKIFLLHGPPGTGKTNALRILARAWKEWCTTQVILDPEALFNAPEYLLEAMDQTVDTPWRLILLEDCDELITEGAKASAGQAMSRLLNASDGLLATGQNILFGVTTNEEIYKLHPAILRPGRCLATLEIPPLTPEEATEWLGEEVKEHMTLAQLYAAKNDVEVLEQVTRTKPPVGFTR